MCDMNTNIEREFANKSKPLAAGWHCMEKYLVSSCDPVCPSHLSHLSMRLGVIFYGLVFSHHPLTTTLHNMSAFFPRTQLKRRKMCLNSMRSGKLSSAASLLLYHLEAAQLHTARHVNLQEFDYD